VGKGDYGDAEIDHVNAKVKTYTIRDQKEEGVSSENYN